MEKLLLTESHQGALSNLQLRDGSAAGPSANGHSNELGLKGASGIQDQYGQEFNNNIEPLNFDMDQDGGALEPMSNRDGAMNVGPGDFPSLRDLETSNAFTRSNLNFAQSKA